MKCIFTFIFLTLLASTAMAEPPEVQAAAARSNGDVWSFAVTLSHPDSGWEHYADGWRILDADGQELGFRRLAHPHVNEQPFRRSLSGVVIPAGVYSVFIQAHCLVDGWGEALFETPLTNGK